MSARISKDGFSLMEAVVSIAIVSIGFVGIYSVFVVAEKSFAKTFEKNKWSEEDFFKVVEKHRDEKKK